MARWRPVDHLPTPTGFAMSRRAAATSSCCARCGAAVEVDGLLGTYADEYRMTSMCPDCQDEVWDEMERWEDEHDG